MARTLLVTCDWCHQLAYAETDATEEVEFTIEGIDSRWDLCDPHYRPFKEILFIAERMKDASASTDSTHPSAHAPDPVLQRMAIAAPEQAELSSPVDARATDVAGMEARLAAGRAELAALEKYRSTEPQQVMLPQAPEPALPPAAPERLYTDGKQRVRCLECPGTSPMLKSSVGQHARVVHGCDPQEVKFEGLGFKFVVPPRLGTKIRGIPSVICRERHTTGTAVPFWVPESNRSSHARSSHPDIEHIADVDYENAMKIQFEVRCKEHPWCAKADGGLGYGFINAHAHMTHMRKEEERAKRQALAANNQT